jgi:hypothetical protein
VYVGLAVPLFVTSMDEHQVNETIKRVSRLFYYMYIINVLIVYAFRIAAFFVKPHWIFVFTITSSYIVLSSSLLLNLNSLGHNGDANMKYNLSDVVARYKAASDAMTPSKRNKILLLIPYHICWGMVNTLWIFHILGDIVAKKSMGHVVIVACLNVFVTILFNVIEMRFLVRWNPSVFVVFGGVCQVAVGVVMGALDDTRPQTWATILILHGIIRYVSENSMAAVITSFFPMGGTSPTSFTGIAKTISSGLAFFIFALKKDTIFYVPISITGGIAIICFILAKHLDNVEKSLDSPENLVGPPSYSTTTPLTGRSTKESFDSMNDLYVAEYY